MYFPLKKEPLKEFRPSMSLHESTEVEYLNESLGGYNTQYETADKLADAVITMLNGGFNDFETSIDIDGVNMPIKVHIEVTNSLLSAMNFNIDPRGKRIENGIKIEYLQMNGTIPSFVRNTMKETEFKYKIKNQISHELMHGNIFSKRAESGVEIDDIPSMYPQIIQILEKVDYGIIREISYAMYVSYYQERQAVVSSEYSQLSELIKPRDIEGLKKQPYDYVLNVFKSSIKKTDSYKTYYYIKNELCPYVESLSEQNISEISTSFTKYGISFTNGLKNEMKRIHKMANGALRDVVRNAALFFNTNLIDNQNGQN